MRHVHGARGEEGQPDDRRERVAHGHEAHGRQPDGEEGRRHRAPFQQGVGLLVAHKLHHALAGRRGGRGRAAHVQVHAGQVQQQGQNAQGEDGPDAPGGDARLEQRRSSHGRRRNLR